MNVGWISAAHPPITLVDALRPKLNFGTLQDLIRAYFRSHALRGNAYRWLSVFTVFASGAASFVSPSLGELLLLLVQKK